ncbi:MAG: ARMT1-like domain-containing protein, partial [Desulfobacteraceae bacterium]
MKTTLDCLVCLVRQSLQAARLITLDKKVHEQIMRDVLGWAATMDLKESPPVMAQRIHRRLRALTGAKDPYAIAKKQMNQMALSLLPELEEMIDNSLDPLKTALHLAIAGNVIDLGAKDCISEMDVRKAVHQAISAPLCGSEEKFKKAILQAQNILYLADNAGEIVFDRLLIEQIDPQRVTLAVRGTPVLN